MTRTLQEITEALEPEAVRAALQQKLEQVTAMIAERVIGYQLEEANPTLREAVRSKVLAETANGIAGLDELRSIIEDRLSNSEDILKGLKKPHVDGKKESISQ